MEFRDVPVPEIAPDEVLIEVKVTSICGTDVHIFEWDEWAQNRIKPPVIQGHEFAGEVAEVGRNCSFIKEGDYVSAEGHIACGHCYLCRTGQAHVCRTVQIIGIDRDGSFAEYIMMPEGNVVVNDADLPLEYASIQDPFGNAVQSVFAADVAAKSVAIYGLGPIGLMCVALCKSMGAAQVFAVGHRNMYRVELADKVGADASFSGKDDVPAALREATDGLGVDAVLEMSGNGAAFNEGLEVLRPGGGMYVLGIYPAPFPVDVSDQIVTKGLHVEGIHGRLMYEDWYRMKGILRSKSLNLDPIITHKLKFDQMVEGMEVMASGKCGKVVHFME
jgi:threonine 3-dehydrogenase